MPVRAEKWAEGIPAWVDVTVTDLDRSKRFYGDPFGWTFDESSEEFGHYSTARIRGHAVAGIGPVQDENAPPPAWMTFLAADSLDDTLAKVG